MKTIAIGMLVVVLATAGCQNGQSGTDQEAKAVEHHSVTVYPVVLGDQPRVEVTRFVAVLLERGGLDTIEVSDVAFQADAAASFEQRAEAFAAFAARQPLKTDYALYGAYRGTPGRSVDEVCSVLADAQGNVIWSDCQKPGDAAFDKAKPKNPMGCTMLLMRRLQEPLQLQDPFREDAPKGTLEDRFRKEDGLPDDAERKAMEQRAAKLREAAPKASVVVYPVRDGDVFAKADDLVAMINERGLLKARVATGERRFEFKPSMNQQVVLWSAARSFRKLVREQPADADYVLAAHYAKARLVHVFVLDRSGEFVIVDFQNSHHTDFRKIKPDSREDCSKLAAVRLASYLK